MFPEADDFIEVSSNGSPHDGLIGKVISVAPNKVTASIYGREVTLSNKEVKLKARVGSRSHSLLLRKSINWETDSLDAVGLYVLMDVALWLRDFDWCKDIQNRMAVLG